MDSGKHKFYIQSGYSGRETSAIAYSYDRSELSYSAVNEYDGEIVVGSVEFVEGIIGQRVPDYYPSFSREYFRRNIYWSDSLPESPAFIKPADRHKRFDARIACEDDRYEEKNLGRDFTTGPYWCSDIVWFENEWRYYVANGKVLGAWWYSGPEECDAPELDIQWPSSFCGAVDFGIVRNKLTLVENNLPYACGWYGPFEQGRVYGEWLEAGWEFIKKL